jgi:hypothetical protein
VENTPSTYHHLQPGPKKHREEQEKETVEEEAEMQKREERTETKQLVGDGTGSTGANGTWWYGAIMLVAPPQRDSLHRAGLGLDFGKVYGGGGSRVSVEERGQSDTNKREDFLYSYLFIAKTPII